MMDRSQKKCLVVSSVFHGSLILLLLFGSALMPKPDETSAHILKMYSADQVSALASSGGSPDANVAPAQPVQPKAATETPPAPKPVVQPPPAPKPVELPKPTPRVVETPKAPKLAEPDTHWYDFSKPKTKPTKDEKLTKAEPTPPTKHKVVIDKSDLAIHKNTADDSVARDVRDANDRARKRNEGKQIAQTIAGLKKDLSTGTTVDFKPGIGGGGEATANYGDIIISKYSNAWNPPADLDNDVPIVTVSVTIMRDGSVKSAHIVTPSGNRSLDRSIENALEAVTFIEQFPAAWKDSERTVKVKFNLQLKRQNG